MMRLVIGLLALAFVASSNALSALPARAPVILWSGTNAFKAQGQQCVEPVDASQLVAVRL